MKRLLIITAMASLAACRDDARPPHKMTKAETFKACMDASPKFVSADVESAKVQGCFTASEAASD